MTKHNPPKQYYYMPDGNHILTAKQLLFKYSETEIKERAVPLGAFPSRKLAQSFWDKQKRR